MANFRVEFTREALESLMKTRRYIADNLMNPQAAVRYTGRIVSAAESLSIFPEMHRVRIKDSEGNALRFFPIDNHIIIYYVGESEHVVNIVNVVYSRRNIDAII